MTDTSGPCLDLTHDVACAFDRELVLARVSSMPLILVCTGDSGRSSHSHYSEQSYPLYILCLWKRICKGNFRQYPFGITRPLEVRPIFWKRWMMFSPRFPVGLLTWNFIPKKSTSTPLNTLSMASLTRGLQDRHSPLPTHTAPAICSILLSWHMHSILLWVAHLPLSIRTQLLLSSSGLLPHMQPTT